MTYMYSKPSLYFSTCRFSDKAIICLMSNFDHKYKQQTSKLNESSAGHVNGQILTKYRIKQSDTSRWHPFMNHVHHSICQNCKTLLHSNVPVLLKR